MSEKCGEVCYDESEKLYFGAEQYESEAENSEFKTEVMFVEDESDSDTFDDEIENREAFCTAKKIASMLENKTEVIIDRKRRRPCEPRDFCILVRKNSYTKPVWVCIQNRIEFVYKTDVSLYTKLFRTPGDIICNAGKFMCLCIFLLQKVLVQESS